MFAVEFAQGVNFQGAEHITIFSSSDWAERGFCQQCGTHLFYRLTQSGHYALPVGLLDNSSDTWEITEQIFIEQKPAYYSLAEKTKLLTGEEVFAQYEQQ